MSYQKKLIFKIEVQKKRKENNRFAHMVEGDIYWTCPQNLSEKERCSKKGRNINRLVIIVAMIFCYALYYPQLCLICRSKQLSNDVKIFVVYPCVKEVSKENKKTCLSLYN